MNGIVEKIIAPGAIFVAWIASFEWRLRGKVSNNRFADLQDQTNRIESHIWDMMKSQGIKATIEPPDEIKNNEKG